MTSLSAPARRASAVNLLTQPRTAAAPDRPARSGWQRQAACGDLDGAWFFPADREPADVRAARTARAKSVCALCPVVSDCLAYALSVREPFGIWGGLTEAERAAALRARSRARSPQRGHPVRVSLSPDGT